MATSPNFFGISKIKDYINRIFSISSRMDIDGKARILLMRQDRNKKNVKTLKTITLPIINNLVYTTKGYLKIYSATIKLNPSGKTVATWTDIPTNFSLNNPVIGITLSYNTNEELFVNGSIDSFGTLMNINIYKRYGTGVDQKERNKNKIKTTEVIANILIVGN